MPQVPTINRAMHLNPPHAVAFIHLRGYKLGLHRTAETRPASAAIEFIPRIKKRRVTSNREVDSILVMIPVGIPKGRLRPLLTGHPELLRGE